MRGQIGKKRAMSEENKMVECEKVERVSIKNLDIVIHSDGKIKRYYITANHKKNGECFPLFDALNSYIASEKATIISHLVFGSCKEYDKSIKKMQEFSKSSQCPVTWLQGDACDCDCLTSTQVTAVSGVKVEPVMLDGQKVGSTFQDDYAKYCYLNAIITDDISKSRAEQTLSSFQKMDGALKTVGMQFTDVIRMWNYLDNLLEWYDQFNTTRTAFFNRHNVFNSIVPAGTGIGASNPANAAYIGEVLAVKTKKDEVNLSALPSPMQCPALNYKSSFSRAIEIDLPSLQYISISGTASIEPGGETMFVDDTSGQIELTMKVISAILESRNMNWSNTAKAIAYFKEIQDLHLFREYLQKMNIPDFPIAISHADICRDNLLFELELDAVTDY